MHEAEQQVNRLLDEERKALLDGAIGALPEIHRALEAAMGALDDSALSEDALAALRDKARRNETLLQAARRGIERTVQRVKDCERAARGLTTYGRDGQMQAMGNGPQRMEKHA